MTDWSLPTPRREALAVWYRNILVWKKMAIGSALTQFGEPFIYLLGLGYGLGMFIGEMAEIPYLAFLASGFVAFSATNTATFEGMWSVYTRMVPQQTYEAILATPTRVDDIVLGELLWCATKGLFSGTAILVVATILGAVESWTAIFALPILFLTGFCFAAPALIMTAVARGYEFFTYYYTLVITPMFILSGVFYPTTALPEVMQSVVSFLPLTHAVSIIRPLVIGQPISDFWFHFSYLCVFGAVGMYVAVAMVRRRLII